MALNAGDIVFDIKGDETNLKQALANVNTHFAGATKAVGVAMTAAGAAITGFAAVSVTSFAQTADELAKMSQRTGFSVTALSELKFAAEQSGTSIEGIEKASRKLSTVIVDAAGGNEQYQQTIAQLGLSWESLATMSPEDQFMAVGLALADVENATLRTSMASDLFGGRIGTQLLPMLNSGSAGLQAMREEARRLGLSIGPEQAAQAELFNDTMDQMKAALGSLGVEVAQILIPVLTDMMIWVKEAAITFRAWRQENPELIATITKLTVAAGAVMTVLGPLLIMLPGLATAFAAVKAAVLAVGAVFGALAAAVSAPAAVVIAAVGAIALAGAALYNYWDEVKTFLIATWEAIANAFELLISPLIYAWESLKGLFGGGTGAINPEAFARYQASQQNSGLPARATGALGNSQASAAPSGGGGGTFVFNVQTNDPYTFSRTLGQLLQDNMAATGRAFG